MKQTAFVQWLRNQPPEDLAGHIEYLILNGAPDELWDILEETGDRNYTAKTFEKAAAIILNSKL